MPIGEDRPIRVFVSSTFGDDERRRVVEDAILRAKLVPVGMDRFTASSRPTVEECRQQILGCDLLIGILAHRYGWIPPGQPEGQERSIAEIEYDIAKEAGKPRLMFVIDESVPIDPRRDFDDGPDRWKRQEQLDRFKAKVTADQMPARFRDETLRALVLQAIHEERGRWRHPEPQGKDRGGEHRPFETAKRLLIEHLRFDDEQLERAVERGRLDETEARLRQQIESLAQLASDAAEDRELLRQLSEKRLQHARVLSDQQRPDDARAILDEVDPDLLEPRSRSALIRAWAALGAPERARAELSRIPPDARPSDFDITEARVSIEEGTLPEPLPDDAGVLAAAAWLYQRRGLLSDAARLALAALEKRPGSAMFAIGPFVLLAEALVASVWEKAWVEVPIGARQVEVIETIERMRHEYSDTWSRIAGQADSEGLGCFLREAAWAYQGAVGEIDPWPEFPPPDDEELRRALERAERDEVEAALAEFTEEEHPWLTRLRRAQLLMVAGRRDEAQAESQALVDRFPHRAPIERLAAAVLGEAGEYERATEHARRAFALVPAGGFRFLLVQCLMAAGKAKEAWALVDPVWRTAGPKTLKFAADAADRVRAAEAKDLWARYVELCPQDVHGRLRLAQALFHANEREHAADRAWEVFERWRQGDAPHGLGPATLAFIGRLQLRPPMLRESRARIERLIQALAERFPDNAQAQQARIVLAGTIDQAVPVDSALMVEAGLAWAIPATEIPRWLEELTRVDAAQWRLYEDGGISLAGLALARGQPLASVLLGRWSDPNRYFCTFRPTRGSEAPVLDGRELIVGSMELLLLAKLELLGPLERLLERLELSILVPIPIERELEEQALSLLPTSDAGREAEWLTRLALDWLRAERVARLDWPELHERAADAPELPPLRMSGDEAARFLRAPLEERVRQVRACHAQPLVRSILTIDQFATAGIGNVAVGTAFAWPSAGHFKSVTEYLRQGAFVSIPELVRAMASAGVLSGVGKHQLAFELAAQGFADALQGPELIALFRAAEPARRLRVLDGLESMVTHGGPSSTSMGRVAIVRVYAEAVLLGALGTPADEGAEVHRGELPMPAEQVRRLPPDERELLLSTVLGRLEQLDDMDGDALDLTLMFVLLGTVERFKDALSPSSTSPSVVELDSKSPVGLLWQELGRWAGEDGSRRAVLDRSVCSAWVTIDRLSPDTGPGVRAVSLLLADSSRRSENALSIVQECVAILSANWEVRVLRHSGVSIEQKAVEVGSEEAEPTVIVVEKLWEDLLEEAANDPDLRQAGDERSISIDYQGGGLAIPQRFELPIEGVVLRMPPDRMMTWLPFLLGRQGPLDGHAYELLASLGSNPEDRRLRREYARHTAGAPWRRVRDDPGYLLRWTHELGMSGTTPATLSSLCRMLHEPVETIVSERLSGALRARLEGPWQHLDDRVRSLLANLVATMPGVHGNYVLPDLEDPEHVAAAVEHALSRLEDPEHCSAGALGAYVCMLSALAARLPPSLELRSEVVDLRDRLPKVFIEVLERMDDPRGGLGRHEPEVLRICSLVVQRALRFQAGRSHRDHLWLTYRFHAWVCQQLEHSAPAARERGLVQLARVAGRLQPSEHALVEPQLFDPFMFRAHGFEFRKAVLLAALISSVSLVRQQEGVSPILVFTSPALEQRLLELAERPVVDSPELGESWIDWPYPIAVPDLAAYWLLLTNPRRFFSSDPDHLVRRIQRWPDELGALREGERVLIELMARGLAFSIDTLAEPVITAFQERLLSLADDPTGKKVQWMGLSALFARGAAELEDRVRELNREHLGQEHDTVYLGFFLDGVIGVDAERLLSEVDQLLGMNEPDDIRGTVWVALARVVIHATQPDHARAAHRALQALAQRPELCDDDGLRALLDHLAGRNAS